MVNGEDKTMVRRWMNVLLTMVVVVALAGLAGCHKKDAAKPEGAAVEQGSVPEEAPAAEPAEGAGEEEQAEEPAGPPPTPAPGGAVTYPAGEGPVLIAGAHIKKKVRELGHWQVGFTVDSDPQRVLAFYRKEAANRGWTEKGSQPMGSGGFITWDTPHGELQLIVGKSPARGSSVELNWNQSQ